MGWKAYYKDGRILEEGSVGRPVQDGEDGQLALIVQEDYGHRVAIDLVNGVVIIDYDNIAIQNGTVEVSNPSLFFYICDETTIVGDLFDLCKTEPDSEGWFTQELIPLKWRPIWFTRFINTAGAVKVLGAQTTLPEIYGGKNIKKLISLIPDGRLGID